MSNCDFGGPCDCLDCRTIHKTVVCPCCGFENTVQIVRDASGIKTDRKGINYYDFQTPTTPNKDLACYKCSFLIKGVGYYTDIDQTLCQLQLDRDKAIEEGHVCSVCQKIEGQDFTALSLDKVQLEDRDGRLLCQNCLAEVLEKEIPNPSNEREKYQFNRRKLKWELGKVKQKCVDCGKERWLNAENSWKKQCESCYKKKKAGTT